MTAHVHLAVALDGYGWHRQAWRTTLQRDPAAPPVLSGEYWAQLAATAERGLLDFVSIDDALTPQPGRRAQLSPGRLVGRADAVQVAARMAMTTSHIGLIPVVTTTHTQPVNIASAIAMLNQLSAGRAGWQPRISSSAHEAALFGRDNPAALGDLFTHATGVVTQVRRFTDADTAHQPVIAALAHAQRVYEFASDAADLVFVTPHGDTELQSLIADIGRLRSDLAVWADLVVAFEGDTEFGSDAQIIAAAPDDVADLIIGWHDLGVAGVRLRPAVHTVDLPVIVDELVPLLQRAGRFRTGYRDGETLRRRLGIPQGHKRNEVRVR